MGTCQCWNYEQLNKNDCHLNSPRTDSQNLIKEIKSQSGNQCKQKSINSDIFIKADSNHSITQTKFDTNKSTNSPKFHNEIVSKNNLPLDLTNEKQSKGKWIEPEKTFVNLEDIKYTNTIVDFKDQAIKFMILGGKEVGKSAFVIRYTSKVFEKLYIPSFDIETKSRVINYDNQINYRVDFTVTPGWKEYQQDYNYWYLTMNFFLVFIDCSRSKSIEDAYDIINQIRKHLKLYTNNSGDQVLSSMIIVNNKTDISLSNPKWEPVKAYCKRNTIGFYDISTKNNIGVFSMINDIVGKYVNL